jgi:hypothetical protein
LAISLNPPKPPVRLLAKNSCGRPSSSFSR